MGPEIREGTISRPDHFKTFYGILAREIRLIEHRIQI